MQTCLGEGQSAPEQVACPGDGRKSLLGFQGAAPAMGGSNQARLRRFDSEWESTSLRWQETWQ